MKPYTRLIVRDLRIQMSIGVYEFEKETEQPVIINIEATVPVSAEQINSDSIDQVLSYERLIAAVNNTAATRHFDLVESFAEEIATYCLGRFPIHDLKIRVEKPEIIINAIVGVEIYRKPGD